MGYWRNWIGGFISLTFSQEFLVDASVNSNAIVQGQAGVQGKAVEILSWVQVDRPIVAVLVHVFDGHTALEVDERHVALYGWLVQCCSRHLATSLTRIIPGRSADGEALTAGNDTVERVQGRT